MTVCEEGIIWRLIPSYMFHHKITKTVWQLNQCKNINFLDSEISIKMLTIWKYTPWAQRCDVGWVRSYFNLFLKYIYRGQSFALPNVVSCVMSNQNISATMCQGKLQLASGGESYSFQWASMNDCEVKSFPWMLILWILYEGCHCNNYDLKQKRLQCAGSTSCSQIIEMGEHQ